MHLAFFGAGTLTRTDLPTVPVSSIHPFDPAHLQPATTPPAAPADSQED